MGWGEAKEPASQCASVWQNFPFGKLTFLVSPRLERLPISLKPRRFRKVYKIDYTQNVRKEFMCIANIFGADGIQKVKLVNVGEGPNAVVNIINFPLSGQNLLSCKFQARNVEGGF